MSTTGGIEQLVRHFEGTSKNDPKTIYSFECATTQVLLSSIFTFSVAAACMEPKFEV